MEFIVLDSDYYNPFVGGKDFHYLAQRGKLDLFFLSGIEIDREANFNLQLIGDPDAPDVRMPGQYGSGLLYYAVPRVILFRTRHDRRTFVERLTTSPLPPLPPRDLPVAPKKSWS